MPISPSFLESLTPEQPDEDRCCGACGYQLRGIPPGSTCPECGVQEVAEPSTTEAAPPPRQPSRCRACKYSLEGLPSAGRCPECGAPYRPTSSWQKFPPLIPDEVLESLAWRLGLVLMALATAVALFMQVVVLLRDVTASEYWGVMAVVSSVWLISVWLTTPSTLDQGLRFIRPLRMFCRWSQCLWPIVFGLLFLQDRGVVSLPAPLLTGITFIMLLLAAVGLAVTISLLAMSARDLYMRPCAGRLNFVTVLFPLFAIGIWIAPYPAYVTVGIQYAPIGYLQTFILLVVLGPWWLLFILVIFSDLQLIDRSMWAVRIRRLEATRPERIAAKRAALNQTFGINAGPSKSAVQETTPQWLESGDIPLSDPTPPDSQKE